MFDTAMFLETMSDVQKLVHKNSVDHGFWEGDKGNNFATKIALIHSELSEALECHRSEKDLPGFDKFIDGQHVESRQFQINETMWCSDDGGVYYSLEDSSVGKLKPEGVGIELADAVIRIMDLCEKLDIDLGQCILDKMAYNATRPHKHGRNY